MTIAILKRTAGQKIARPFNRASTIEEMKELIGWAGAWHLAPEGLSSAARARFADSRAQDTEEQLAVRNIDTDEPIFSHNGVEFFAFMER